MYFRSLLDGVLVGQHVVRYNGQWVAFVPFLISIEDESVGLRPIKCLAGTCENNIPV